MTRSFLSLSLSILFLVLPLAGCSASSEDDDSRVTSVPQRAIDVTPLLIGESIPDITLQNNDNETFNLSETESGPTLYVFYRGGWCPYCSAELAEIASIEDQLYDSGFEIVAISPDSPEFLRSTMDSVSVNYTLLSDSKMDASKAFGIAFRLDDETYQRYRSNGMDLENRSGQNHHLLPVPSVFMANSEGIIEFQYVNPDYRQRIDKDVLMAAAVAMTEPDGE